MMLTADVVVVDVVSNCCNDDNVGGKVATKLCCNLCNKSSRRGSQLATQ